jgi:hypothetical protein
MQLKEDRKNTMNVTETMADSRAVKANSARMWLFRVLVVVVAGVMLVSWFLPWWTADIEALGNDIIQIRPWGLHMDERLGGFAILLKGAPMPAWFAPMMWTYLGLCMLALLVGMAAGGRRISLGGFKIKLSQFLIGGVGLSYIIAGIVAAVYASIRMKSMGDIPLQGSVLFDLGDPLVAMVNTRLLPGYYLIYAAGLLFLVLAVFQDTITGEK